MVDMSGFMVFGGSFNDTIAPGNSPMRVQIRIRGHGRMRGSQPERRGNGQARQARRVL